MVKCPKCEESNTAEDWNKTTAQSVIGEPDTDFVFDIADETGRVPYFYVCPSCDRQVQGSEL